MREILTDERLNELADRFIDMGVREKTGVSFAHYLRDPDHYDSVAVQLACEARIRSMAAGSLKTVGSHAL